MMKSGYNQLVEIFTFNAAISSALKYILNNSFLKSKLKLMNLNSARMQKFFKKILLITGLIAIFASAIQQDFDIDTGYSIGSAHATVVQLDKDSNRDVGDKAVIATHLYNQCPKICAIYYFLSASYQEPTLLVHLRPPNV